MHESHYNSNTVYQLNRTCEVEITKKLSFILMGQCKLNVFENPHGLQNYVKQYRTHYCNVSFLPQHITFAYPCYNNLHLE
jgi:hypothetical protein